MSLFTPARRNMPELLDRADNPLDQHLASLKDLQWFNARWGGTRIVLDELERVVGSAFSTPTPEPQTRNLTFIDIGTGSADVPRAVAAWARARGLAARVIGLDLHPVNLRLARRETRGEPAIALARGDALRLPFRDGSADVVMCSLFLHHFTEPEAVRILREFRRVARRAVLVFDLRRSYLLYGGLKLLTAWKARSPITAYDGPVSALRAFTTAEVAGMAREAGLERFEVRRRFPFRWALNAEQQQ